MWNQTIANQAPKLTRAKLLAEIPIDRAYSYSLFVSQHGFLLAFNGDSISKLTVQLRPFDAEEWHCNMDQFHSFELESLNDRLMLDATELLLLVLPEDLAYTNPFLLQLVNGNLNLYNRLHSSSSDKINLRVQALQAVPILRWILSWIDQRSDQVRKCIDTQGNLWEAIHTAYPGRKATLKRLAKDEHVFDFWKGNLPDLQRLLDPIPLQKLPNSRQEWQAFMGIYQGLRIEGEYLEQKLSVKRRWLVEAAKMGWVKTFEKYENFDEGVFVLGNAFDLLDELARAGNWLVKNVRQCRRSDKLSEAELLQLHWQRAPDTLGMSRLVEASVTWHKLMIRHYENKPNLPRGELLQWPSLFKEPLQLTDDVQAVVLTQSQELAKEGEDMKHCVSRYDLECYQGHKHIISLRDREGKSLTTLEIVNHPHNSWKINQHCTEANKRPSEDLIKLEPLVLNHIERYADISELSQWKDSIAQKHKNLKPVFESTFNPFNIERLRKLSAALGHDRLLSLFVDPSIISASVRKFKESI